MLSVLCLDFGRVVHDPFSAAGRIGPAFMPGKRTWDLSLGFDLSVLCLDLAGSFTTPFSAAGRIGPAFMPGETAWDLGLRSSILVFSVGISAGSFTTLFRPQAGSGGPAG